MKQKLASLALAALLAVALPVLGGCADDGFTPFGTAAKKDKKDEEDDGKSGKGGKDTKTPEECAAEATPSQECIEQGLENGEGKEKVLKPIDNSGANFQVKDVNLLRSSLVSCMGSEDMIKVKNDMLLNSAAALPDAKIRFLSAAAFAEGDDIVLKMRGDLVDPEKAARTSTAADGVTDTYLRALEGIANVVAHNCALDNPLCQCDEKEKVLGLFKRCMPGVDPETKEVDQAAQRLTETCSDGAKGMREVIATLLSSYAFAAAR